MKCYILFMLLFTASISHAQQFGCFKTATDNTLELSIDSNIRFDKYDAFFLGEFHGVYGVSEVKLALLKYLNKNFGLTDVFMEIGRSAAYLYNLYLSTGDTTLFTSPVLIYAQKKPNRDFWKNLYRYNKTLEHKITIRGMDFERAEFLKVLKMLAPKDKEKPLDIYTTLSFIDTVTIDTIGWLHGDIQRSYGSLYEDIRAEIDDNRSAFEQYFGDNMKQVDEIMYNEDTYSRFGKRNKTMYTNVVNEIERDSIKKFIVFAGLNHGNMAHKKTLAGSIKKKTGFKGRFVNIAMTCKNCYDWQLKPQYRFAPNRAPYTYYLNRSLMDDIYKEYFNSSCKYTLLPSAEVDDPTVKRFSNYIVLMKDQPEF